MSSLEEIQNGFETPGQTMIKAASGPVNQVDPHAAMIQEMKSLSASVEAILIWLKITNRLSEAQYNFVFGHVVEQKPLQDESLESYLTRSAIELDKKLKNAGLI